MTKNEGASRRKGGDGEWGAGQDRNKPVLFSMARLDNIKNLTALAQWYGGNERLRKLVNLVIVGGVVDPAASHDRCLPSLQPPPLSHPLFPLLGCGVFSRHYE